MKPPLIWIVNPYGNLPGDSWREYRSQTIAEALERRGCEVRWWISNVEHRSRRTRSVGYKQIQKSPLVSIEIVPSRNYKRNISAARLLYEATFARNFFSIATRSNRPDMIIVAEPAIFTGPKCTKLAKQFGCPLIVDIIDIWPELFRILLPSVIKKLDHVIFMPLYNRRLGLLRAASGIISVSEDYDNIASRHGLAKPRTICYLGIDLERVRSASLAPIRRSDLANIVSSKSPYEKWIIYAGTIGEAYDIDAVLEASDLLNESHARNIRIFIAGEGPRRADVEARSVSRDHLVYLGNLDFDDLSRFFCHCDVGICSYHPESTVAMPTKFFDYLAAGLLVVTSLKGEAGRLVRKHKVGLTYEANSGRSMASAIAQLLESPEAQALASASAKALAETFDVRAQHDQLASWLLEIIGQWKNRTLKG